jgi:hypothetical protein
VGAVIGVVLAVVVVLIIDHFKSHPNNLLWLPAGIALGLVGGGVIGLLLTEVVIGGREDEQAEIEAREKIEEVRRRGQPRP